MCALPALMRRQGTHREMRESDDRVEVRGRSDSAQRLTFLKGVERVRASTSRAPAVWGAAATCCRLGRLVGR